jgi:hypothetical protein
LGFEIFDFWSWPNNERSRSHQERFSVFPQERSCSPPQRIVDMLYYVLKGTSHAFNMCVRPYDEWSRAYAKQSFNPSFSRYVWQTFAKSQTSWFLSISASSPIKYPSPLRLQFISTHFYPLLLNVFLVYVRECFWRNKPFFILMRQPS